MSNLCVADERGGSVVWSKGRRDDAVVCEKEKKEKS